MSILVGAHPGGRNSFAVSALFWSGRLPAMLIGSRAYSGVNAVLEDIMGVFGEWGELTAAAIDAPMTWSGSPNGMRPTDEAIKTYTPSWVPKTWNRSPNALPGAVGIQGPALAWALKYETREGNLPKHRVVEARSRLSMARTFPDLKNSVLGYVRKDVSQATRTKHIKRLVERLIDAGIIKLETEEPATPAQLQALFSALTALGFSEPGSGLVTHEFTGGKIRPVGNCPLVVLDALP